jgi:uracil-DNA glycosylase
MNDATGASFILHRASKVPMTPLPASWAPRLADEVQQLYFRDLQEFVAQERRCHEVYPPADKVFAALELTPLESVKAVLLGQDPYHGTGQAHGLCFSVLPGVRKPPSLVNILKELNADLGCPIPPHGCLVTWAENGVLMLNAVLTVRSGEPNSHKGWGWEKFTDAVIRLVSARDDPAAFLLWGSHAQAKKKLIDMDRHAIFEAPHPSPLAAKRFAGCRHFSKVNAQLAAWGRPPIDWRIPDKVVVP